MLMMTATVTLPTVAGATTSHAYEPMPNFVGMGRSTVFSEMYSAHLYYKTQGLGANTTHWVRVIGEIPAAGTQIQSFSTVILTVTTVPLPVAPAHTTAVVHPKKPVIKLDAVSSTRVRKPPVTPKKVVRHVVSDFRVGEATWYSYIPGQCATWYLPLGTRINVEDIATGHVISCVVTDREAARGNRVVDLSETQFAQLAPLSQGVLAVRVTW